MAKLNEIKLLQWSTTGLELAVIDEIGNLTILGTGVSKSNSSNNHVSCFEDIEIFYQDDILNELNLTNSKKNLSTDTFFNDILSFKWLNTEKPIIYTSPAAKNNDNVYNYSVHQYKPYGVIHPAQGKAGCFAIRRNGLLSFYYQTLNSSIEFKKIDILLEDKGEILIDFAGIGFQNGNAMIVTFNKINYQLKIYKVLIDWGNQPNEKLSPVLKIEKLITENINRIGSNGFILELDSIDVISPNFSSDTSLDILLSFNGPGISNGRTLLQKYQISNKFDNLRFKNEVVSIDGYPNLILMNEIIIHEKIISILTKNFDFLLVLITEKGEVQLRSRKTLNLHTQSHSSIETLLDVGFKFELPKKIPDAVGLSVCLCGYVSLKDGDLSFQPLLKDDDKEWNEDEKSAVSAGISYLFAGACYTNTGADELIASTQDMISKIDDLNLRENITLKILEESHKALNFSLDFSKDQIDRLLVNPPIQKLLSLQYSLGKYARTNEQSSIALCVLNLRLVSFSVMLSLRTLFHQQQRIAKKGNVESLIESLHRSENLLSTIGTINWFIEFLIFSLQELINLSVNSSHKNIVLALLLSKIPRSLMIYSIAGIKRIEAFLNKMEENYKINRPQILLTFELFNISFERFKNLLNMIDIDTFEKFLNEIETILSNNNNNGLKIEQELVFLNSIPNAYKPLVPQIFNKFQERFMNLNLSNLFFHDTNWLNFQIKQNEKFNTAIINKNEIIQPSINLKFDLIDDVTKTKIIKKEKLKKCARCEYITSGLNETFSILGPSANGLPLMNSSHWPVAFQRTCICGSCWIYVSEDEISN